MAYGDRYILLSSDVFERKFKVQIQEKDYTGVTENLTAAGNSPVTIGFEGKGGTNVNKYDQIKATHCTISVYSTVDYQFLDLFTSDANKYKVIVSVDENGTYIPIFIGFIEPDIYEEPYIMVPYEVTIRAVDGLVRLKTTDFKDTGLSDAETQLNILLWCLNQTGLGLNLETFGQIYETRMTRIDDESVFYYAYNNLLAFEGMTAYEVLTEILTVYGCFLMQYRGQWVIGRIDERFENIPLTFKYLADGSSNGHGSLDLVKSFTAARATKEQLLRSMYSNTVLMVAPAWKSFTINQDYIYNKSILINFSLKEYTTVGGYKVPTNWTFHKINASEYFRIIDYYGGTGDSVYEMAVIYSNDNPTGITSNSIALIESNLVVGLKITGKTSLINVQVKLTNGVLTYYLYRDGDDYKWGASNVFINFDFRTYDGYMDYNQTLCDFATKATPISGNISVRIDNIYDTGNFYTFIDNVFLILKRNDTQLFKETKVIKTLVSNNNYIPSDINVKIGDIPDFPDTEKVYYGGILLSDGTATKEWTDSYSSFSGELLLCLAYNMGRQYKTPSLMLQGTFKGVMDFMTTMVDESNLFRKFVWSHQVEYNVKQAEINGYMVELLPPPGTRVLGDESGNAIEFETDLLIEV